MRTLNLFNGQSCSSATTSCTVTGLTNGTSYTFTVTATNASGTGAASAASAAVVPSTVPGTASISGFTYGDSSVTLSWTAPVNNGGSDITGYTVTSEPEGKTCTTIGATTCDVTGLTNGTNYTFSVKATNRVGSGAASVASNAITPGTVATVPLDVTATSDETSKSTVSWSAPSSNGGYAITGYVVLASDGHQCEPARLTTLSCQVTGLRNGVAYTFTVFAINANGLSVGATSGPATPSTVPDAAFDLTATSYEPGRSTVSWSEPTFDGGSIITSYTVTSAPGNKTCTVGRPTIDAPVATSCVVTGLTNGTNYRFTVTATNRNGTGTSSGQSNGAIPAAEPGAPSKPSVSNTSSRTVVVSWTAPTTSARVNDGGAPIQGYVVVSDPATDRCYSASATDLSCTFTWLANGTSYTFRVMAYNAVGVGAASLISGAVTPVSAPDAPLGVIATSFQDSKATVSWTAPFSNGLPITGYVVTSTPEGKTCTTTGATSCVVTGLTNGTAYSFAVTATNSKGTGALSDGYFGVVPATVPTAPLSAAAVSGDQSVTVSWSVPSSNGGAPITGYTVTSTPGSFTCVSISLSCTVSGLTNGTTYTFRVVAKNGSGTSAASSSVSSKPLAAPQPPTGVSATSGADAQSVVSWTAPTNTGGSAITGYTVTSTPGALTCSGTGSATSCTVSGLTNGVSYRFTVVAKNLVGSGEASALSAAATPSRAPDAPAISSVSTSHRAAIITWNPPRFDGGAAVTGYSVQTFIGTTVKEALACTGSSNSRNCTITGLVYGTAYNFKVVATNARGAGTASNASFDITPLDPPSAPRTVTATSNEDSRSTISWTAPAETNGSAISSYKVVSDPGGLTCRATGATSCSVTGLTNGTPYRFTVVAVNGVGSGDVSSYTAWATPSTVPSAPQVRSASAGVGSVSVTVNAPSNNGGAPVTSYVVVSSPEGRTCTASDAALGCTVVGLTKGTAYTFTVTAVNASGSSAASPASAAVTPTGVPDAPSAVIATAGRSQVTVSWTAPSNGGSAIVGYTVTSSPGGQTCSPTATTGVNSLKCTVSGLTNGTSYSFTVRASNAVGAGEVSAAALAVPTGIPGAPSSPVFTTGNALVTISWTAPGDGGAAISKYRLQRCKGSICRTIELDSSNGITNTAGIGLTGCDFGSRTCTFSDLENESQYVFSVAASNANGYGPQSAFSASATPRAIPSPAVNLVATAYSSAVGVQWKDSAGYGDSGRIYTVTATPGGATCSTATLVALIGSCLVSGLTNGTSYIFSVTITNSAGTGPASSSVSATPATVPEAPTAVVGTSFKNGQVPVSWTPGFNGGSAITGYTVSDGAGHTCSTMTTSCTVTGLTNGVGYAFSVTATNALGSSAASVRSAPAKPATAPSAPTFLRIQQLNTLQALATWRTPDQLGGSSITGYTVRYQNGSVACTGSEDYDFRSCVFNNPTEGQQLTVTATTAAGESVQSDSLWWFTSFKSGNSGSSKKLVRATYFASIKRIRVGWELQSGQSGEGVTATAYRPGYGSSGSCTGSSAQRSCWIDVSSRGTYNVKVSGGGATSEIIIAEVIVYDRPAEPLSVSAVSGVGSATVSWSAPSSDGGLAIIGYTVSSSPGGLTCTTQLLSCTIYGLNNNTNYTFSVTADNGLGVSTASAPSPVVTTADVPGAPRSVSATAGSGSAVVSWSAPTSSGGSTITGYRAVASPGGSLCVSTSTSCTINGLTPGASYTFTVSAVNAVGIGSASAATPTVVPTFVRSVPGTPSITSLVVGDASVSVGFSQPDNGYSPITSYTVTANPGAATCTNAADGQFKCTIIGLTNGASYTFTVTATNAIGTSAPSSASRSVVPSTAPGVPTNVTGADSPGAVAVSWSEPTSSGGAAISSYAATAYSNGTSTGKVCSTTNGSTLTCTITGLTNGASYTFKVVAFNANGGSGNSAASALVIVRTRPDAPVITSQESGIGAVKVTWSAPAFDGGSVITSYTVRSSTNQTCTALGSERSCWVTGLLSNGAYSFTVVATNAVNDSSSSAAVAGSTPLTAAPSKPLFDKVYSTGTQTAKARWFEATANGSQITAYVLTSYDNTAAIAGPGCTTSLLQCDLSGLVSGHSYTFSLTATNAIGTSTAGATSMTAGLTFNPAAADGMFFVPVQLTFDTKLSNSAGYGSGTTSLVMGFESTAAMDKSLTSTSGGILTVSWTAPTLANGRAIVGYVVTVKSPSSVLEYCVTTTLSCSLRNLAGSTAYTVTVTPFSGGLLPVMVRGKGLDWNVVSLPSSAPQKRNLSGSIPTSAPTDLRATAGYGSVTLSWMTPDNFGTGQLYLVQDSTNAFSCLTEGTACTVGGLTNGTAYSFTVRAVKVDGSVTDPNGAVTYRSGTASSSVSATPLNTIPKEALRISTAYSVSGLVMSTSSAAVAYQFLGSIQVDTQAMQVLVTWTNAGNWTVTAISVPSSPSSVWISRGATDDPTKAKISWVRSDATGGSAITGYTATLTSVGLATPIVRLCTATGAGSSCVITDLPPDVAFVASVVATNLVGDSSAASSNLPGVALKDNDVPAGPRNVSGVSAIGSVTVSWSAPLNANGSSITKYTASTAKVGSVDSVVHSCTTTTGLSCTITGLLNGIGYTISVTATNTSGTSTSSTLSSANGRSATNIKAGFLSAAEPLEPGAITDLNVVSRTPVDGGVLSNNAVLTWTAAPDNGSEIIGYVVTSTPDNLQCTTTKPGCVIPNLVSGRNYTFKVVAYNRVGYSPSVTSNEITGGVLSDGTLALPSSSVSFFGADPVRVSGTVTASLVNGKVVLSGTLTSDTFTAKAGSLTLTDVQMVWRAAAQGSDDAGWSGTGTLSLGFGIKITMKVSNYTDSGNWTLSALVTTGRPELLKGKLTLPEFSFGGTVSSSNGTVVWALSATMGQLNVIPGLLKLTDTALSISNACPVLSGTTTQVCPKGNNGIYLSIRGTFTITIANRDYVSVSGYLVAGLDSRTVVLTVKFADIDFGAGVVLAGPMLQLYQATPGTDPTTSSVAISSVPGQPGSVQFTPVNLLGESHVGWTAPTSTGGRDITGYTVVATPVTKVDDTQTLQPVTCTVGDGAVTVTTTPVKSGSDFATRNPTRRTMSVTGMNLFCDFTGLNPGTDYTYSVTAINANGPGVAAVSGSFKGVEISVEGLDKAEQIIVMSGGLALNQIGLSLQVDATVFPLGSDNKPLSATNALASGSTPKWGWSIVGTVSSEQSKNAMTFLPASLTGSFAYTTNEAKATMNAETVTIPARTVFFGVNMVLSDGMKQVIKGVDSLNGFVWYSLESGQWELKITLGTGWVAKFNKVELLFVSTSITASGTGARLDSFGITEDGAVKFPNNDGSTTTIKASLSVSLLDRTSIVFGITLSPGTAGGAIWPNMFGYKGFNLITGSLSVGFDGSTGYPILGLMGTVEFPAGISRLMGGTAETVVTLAGNMSTSNPCASISVAAKDGVSNVVNIANGALTASKFMIGLAPMGCTIGAGANAFTMGAGASLAFNGSITGVPVAIALTIAVEEKASGTPDVTVTGSATVGALTLGQLKMDPSVLELNLTNKTGGLERFKLSGGASLLGMKFTTSAQGEYVLGSTDLNIKMVGSLAHGTVGGIGFDDISFSYSLATTSLSAFSVSFNARLTLAPGFSIAESGSMTPTQFQITADTNITWGGLQYHVASTTVLGSNGNVPVISTSTALSVNLWGTYYSGTMSVTNDANGFQSVSTFAIQLRIGGFNLGAATYTETVTLSGNNVQFRRRITEDLNLGVMHGRLDAEVAAGVDGGTPVLLFNTYIGISVGIDSYQTSGTLHISDCGNPCVNYAGVTFEVSLSLEFAGRTVVSPYVSVNYDFSFTIEASSSFDQSSGIVYICDNCVNPGSAGLLRYQAAFRGDFKLTLSSSSGLSISTSAKAKLQGSASKSTCGHYTLGICDRYDYSWGSFVDKFDLGVSINRNGKATAEWSGKRFEVDLTA